MMSLGPPIGVYENGDPWCLGAGWMPHTLVAGMTGSGKSNTIEMILKKVLYSNYEIYGIDLKGGRALKLWLPRLKNLATTGTQATDVIMLVEAMMKRRLDSDQETFPGLMLVIDELAEFVSTIKPVGITVEEWKDAKSMAKLEADMRIATLESVARLGREVNVTLIAATQHPTIQDAIPGQVKRQMDRRICCRVDDEVAMKTILGTVGDWRPEDIRRDLKGSAIVTGFPGSMDSKRLARTPEVTNQNVVDAVALWQQKTQLVNA